jgi:alpha-tubulin suppressor-like RCC1 family protein
VWAWGDNESGQLGYPGSATYSGGVKPNPALVAGITGITSIACGDQHMMALRKDGTVWTWGSNYYGQLGTSAPTGNAGNNSPPTQVPGLTSVIQVAAGSEFSLALRSNGTVWAWGLNAGGRLGNNTNLGTWNPNSTPLQVQGLSKVTAIAATSYHSLAIRQDGTVWAWGLNYFGQLGQPGGQTGIYYNAVPKQVPGLAGIVAVATGENHSLAVKSDGTVWAWGSNTNGQLGNDTGLGTNTPHSVPVQVNGLTNVRAVSGGSSHSLAVEGDGTVWAWGSNLFGQLGNSTGTGLNPVPTGNFPVPTQIPNLTNVTAIASGSQHNLALKSDSTVWAWGYNVSGQLGNSTNIATRGGPDVSFTANPTPVLVQGIANATAIGAGDRFSAAITKQPPLATDFTQQLLINTRSTTIRLRANDPQGNPITFSIVTPPQHGTLTAPLGAYVTYTPDATLTTGDSFTFQAANGPNASNLSNIATCTIVPDHPPVVVSLIPAKFDDSVTGSGGSSLVGETLKLTLKGSDPEGADTIKTLYCVFNKSLGNASGIVLTYDRASNKAYLRSSDGKTQLGGLTVGSDGTVENDYGVLDYSKSTVVKGGNSITVTFVVTPKAAFTGEKKLWGAVKDTGNLQAPYSQQATWTVNPAPAQTFSAPQSAVKSSANDS